METLLTYLLKASALLSIFYLSYFILLKKETSFDLNRKFLLAGLLSSFLLPLIYFTRKIYIEATPQDFGFIPANINAATTSAETSIDWWQLAAIAYFIVTGFFILRLCLQLASVTKLIISNKTEKVSGFQFLRIEEDQLPFSFFNYIAFNPRRHTEKELELILEHEKVHARQFHSADILLANLISCLLWFNPFAWLYKKSIEQNLEFIADRETVKSKSKIKEYQRALVKVSVADLRPALTNHFYQSFIKKRILMLNKKSSTNSPAWKIGLVMPLLLTFMLLFNVKTEAQVVENEENKEPEEIVAPAETAAEEILIEEIETEEEIEAAEDVEVEVAQNPMVKWKVKSSQRPSNSLSELGNNPLYVIEGKRYKASRLNNKYIGLGSGLEILTGDKAVNQYGKDGENGVIIIPEAEVIRNFNKEMKQIRNHDRFKGRYILVGEDGKPNFLNLNSSESPAPRRTVYFSSDQPVYAAKKLESQTIVSAPDSEEKFIIRQIPSEKSGDIIAYQMHSGTTIKGYGKSSTSNIIRETIPSKNGPIYVINGKVKAEGYDHTSIKPKNIKQINVLKGHAATEKYGEKAGKGVIEIQTKSDASTIERKMVKLHAGMSDPELEEVRAKLKDLTGIELEIDNISRNDGLITSIRLKSSLDGKQISSGHFEDSNSIPNIYVGLIDDKPVVYSSRD